MLLFIPSVFVSAQEFAPVGAIWHYDQATINPNLTSYHTIESMEDTIIQGVTCRKLMVTSRHAGVQASWLYMYSDNDVVYMYADDAFHLIYDFSASAGDTVIMGYYKCSNGLPLVMYIDSVSTIIINMAPRRVQYVTCGDGISIEFGGTVIEGVGNTYYLLPIFDMNVNGPLRCYSDLVIGSYIHFERPGLGWNFQDCDQEITLGVDVQESFAGVRVYPNPASTLLFVSGIDAAADYRLFDLMGRLAKSGSVAPGTPIDMSGMPDGIYSLVLLYGDTPPITVRVVKH